MQKSQIPETELLFRETLEELKKENKISGFIHAKKNGDIDSNGIDFLVFLIGGLSVTVQIKSLSAKIEEHLRKHPLVQLVIIAQCSKNNADRERIRKELEKEFIERVNDFIRGTRLI